MPESNDRGALTEAVYYILLSLLKPLHGYGIMQKVSELSHQRVNLGSGTLYGAINTLMDKQWIKLDLQASEGRKKAYVITSIGLEALNEELIRLKELVHNGHTLLGGTNHD